MRRAEYSQGAGRLSVGDGWLLFVYDGQHPSVQELEGAAHSDQPGRALAKAVAQTGFDTSPFVFARIGNRLQGIVFGDVQLQIHDGEVTTVDGSAADPWAHFDASNSSTLVCGNGELSGGLWVEVGVVHAESFRWHSRSGEDNPAVHSASSESAPERERVAPPSMASGGSTPDISEQEPSPGGSEASLLDALNSEFDATIDAIRFAEIRDGQGDEEPTPPKRRSSRSGEGAAEAAPRSQSGTKRNPVDGPAVSLPSVEDSDATIDLRPGQVMLDSLHAERRMVEALVCIRCENPNPPAAVSCRHCGSPLSSLETELREVPQPVLGVIHLSGSREELLDADLLIGRNPGYLPLESYQRAVVHAEEDRSVSRRHIELKLEQWKVMVFNLQKSARAIIERQDGRRTKLVAGTPQQLRSGDTVHYGGAWLRFEAEE